MDLRIALRIQLAVVEASTDPPSATNRVTDSNILNLNIEADGREDFKSSYFKYERSSIELIPVELFRVCKSASSNFAI